MSRGSTWRARSPELSQVGKFQGWDENPGSLGSEATLLSSTILAPRQRLTALRRPGEV